MITSRKAIWIFSIAAVVAILTFLSLSAMASAAVINVPGDYPTIQQAINNVNLANRTIEVNATAYNAQGIPETVDVTQSNIIIRSVNGQAVVSAEGAYDHVFDITDQTNVTLEGFEIRDTYGAGEAVAGIYMENASTCTISNISVSNIGSDYDVYGIYLSSSHNNVFNSTISVTDITSHALGYSAYGIYLADSSNNNTFSASTTVSDITSKWGHIACGIYLADSSNNNTFSASTTVSNIYAYSYSYGIYLSDSSNNAFNATTTVSAISAEWDPYGIYLSSSSNNTFSASTNVSNLAGDNVYGIYLAASSNNRFSASTTVSNLESTYMEAYGIYLAASSNNNTFSASTAVSNISTTNFAYGIRLSSSSNNNTFSASTAVSNISTTNFAYGIRLSSSSNNNTISANTTVSNISARYSYGIDLSSSCNNRFSASTTVSTISATDYAYGIYLYSANNNRFADFTITGITSGGGSTSYGISLWGRIHKSCSGNVFSGGSIYSNGDPRIDYAVWLDTCTHNTINASTIVENGHGFWLNQSDYNTIERNMIVNNTALYVSGVYLTAGSDNNELHENCFYDNGLEYQAWDDGMNNDWDSNFWSDYPQWGVYAIAGSAGSKDHSTLRECGGLPNIFDTDSPANPYPSLSGTHNGTITPFHDIVNITTLYTYPCSGTGGHTEYIKIWNSTTGWNVTVSWNGYTDNWHNIIFNNSFTLYANETYNYTICTGSYPQIIHEQSFNATGGVITCEEFMDINGKRHEGWIPAIRLS